MQRKKFTYWQEEDMWIGYLEEFPDYWTQGETLEELKENLKDLWKDLTSGAIPYARSEVKKHPGSGLAIQQLLGFHLLGKLQ